MSEQNSWAKPTRFLHLGLAATVTFQLFISLVMEEPEEGKVHTAFESLSFEAHEWVGMLAVLIVFCHGLWIFVAKDNSNFRNLFPLSAAGRAQVMSDIRNMFHGKLPEGGGQGGLPGLVHGLGFLAVAAMALTGAVLFVLEPWEGGKTLIGDVSHEMHEIISNLVWAYWGGHLATAMLHKRMGHDTVKNMFTLR